MMTKITLDEKEYETDDMSENALEQLTSLQFAAAKNQQLQALLATQKTALNTDDRRLQAELAVSF